MKESIIMQSQISCQIIVTEIEKYKQIMKFLIFLIIKTRLNIILAIAFVKHFLKNVFYQYTKAIKTIFKSLKEFKK